MLTEIYCAAFGETKRIPFSNGLNVIQGHAGDSESGGGNSIGKTSMLKIIDYAFGGKYYADSNDDIIRHVGEHDVCFTHTFNGTSYYFCRNASKPGAILWCKDSKYTPQREISEKEFGEWLVEQYGLQDLRLTFRGIIGLYSRIWNKPNKEVSRPLYKHNAQTVRDSIMSLVKLFGKYDSIQELSEHDEYLRNRSRALAKANTYHLVALPTKDEAKKIEIELAEISETISRLKAIIAITGVENADHLSSQKDELLESRMDLLAQQDRINRALHRCARQIQRITPVNETTFSQLLEFFPEVNIQRIKEVQGFHTSLRNVLINELNNEIDQLQQQLAAVTMAISSNDAKIQKLTGLPTQTAEAMEQLIQLTKRQEQLQFQQALYNDKIAEAAQSSETKRQLTQLLGEITVQIEKSINEKIGEYSSSIMTSNNKAPKLHLSYKDYEYGVEDNTGTGKAYTDLLLFDLAILSLSKLPVLIHDSFLFNNIDVMTKLSFLRLYSQFKDKQIFISLDEYLGTENTEIDKILFTSTRLFLSGNRPLFGKDWRTE
ncbi:MAG: DUF2326 domain-containing protein [Oscillospiraceae bacterium]|nr:DUF2326 domain-containing protein [Oscillospiraceae bacterium]